MTKSVKDRVPLNRITHAVRAAQAVLQYGVGAMVDFPDQTLMTAAPEYWTKKTRIEDERLAKALGVEYFCSPIDVSYARFPEWYFCPRCRRFQPISKWLNEYKRKARGSVQQRDTYMTSHIRCYDCYQELVVARIVTVCEKGHIDDFPWIEWTHKKSKKTICSNPKLRFKTGASGTEGLEGLQVTCDTCKARATLTGAFDKEIFSQLDGDSESRQFYCKGRHPWKNEKEECACYPRTVQRGSSSVYFPLVYSSLVIPPYSDKLNILVEKSDEFDYCVRAISDEEPKDRLEFIDKKMSKWSEKIALEIAVNKEEVQNVLRRKWLEPASTDSGVSSVKYRIEEYKALNGEVTIPDSLGEFSRESIPITNYNFDFPFLKQVTLIDKIRVVSAHGGFSRLSPVMNEEDRNFVCIKEKETHWFPAYEVRGEGIFVEFSQEQIDKWILQNACVSDRANKINENYSQSFISNSNPREITAKFILLHTISHLLIKQLSFECGYSIASLSERIYCSEMSSGKAMSGIFIYTADGDSEGTLGGLVRQGRPDTFSRIFKRAIDEARTCSNDPVCILSQGSGRESLNLAACHSCALLPETCCEEQNSFLDRGMIVGTFEDNFGFFKN